MTLHLTRSGGGEGSREKCDDKVIFPVILIGVVEQPVLAGGKTEIQCLGTDQIRFFRLPPGKGEEEENDKEHKEPVTQEFSTHDDLLFSV